MRLKMIDVMRIGDSAFRDGRILVQGVAGGAAF